MKPGMIACVAAALMMVLAGCGEREPATVSFGAASAARKAEFAAAVGAALKGFEDLDSQGVQIAVADAAEGSAPQVTVRGGSLPPEALEQALRVALTNMSFKYPGIGFMATGDGGWKILMPDELKIPESGGFELDFR